MLYLKKNISDTTIMAIWKIEESIDEILDLLNETSDVDSIMNIKLPSRRLEKLITLKLLTLLLGADQKIVYSVLGKPYLANSKWNISISHTKGYVAVIVSENHVVGIDIEQISDRIRNIQSRIVSPREIIELDNELVHILLHWCAKETMFKMIDEGEIDFLEHLYIHPFVPRSSGEIKAEEFKTTLSKSFAIRYTITEDFVLTYSIGE